MTDQKDSKESQSPFYNPHTETKEKPSHSHASTAGDKTCVKQKASGRTVRLLLSILLLAVAVYLSFNYFTHRHSLSNTESTVNTTESIPDSGKNSTLVTPTTATNDSSNHAFTSAS